MVDSIRINAGGGAIGIYGADAYYSGGQSASSNAPVDSKSVYYPANQEVYQTERYGTFTYTFTDLVPNGIHTVKLHFNEHFWDSVGKRKFNAAINGSQVLWDYDIFSQAGGFNTFSSNRVEIPVLANGIAIYGGESNVVTDNYVADQQAEGGGIHVGNRFPGDLPKLQIAY